MSNVSPPDAGEAAELEQTDELERDQVFEGIAIDQHEDLDGYGRDEIEDEPTAEVAAADEPLVADEGLRLVHEPAGSESAA